jgi:hypothetical protein
MDDKIDRRSVPSMFKIHNIFQGVKNGLNQRSFSQINLILNLRYKLQYFIYSKLDMVSQKKTNDEKTLLIGK